MLIWVLIGIGLVTVLYLVNLHCKLVNKRESYKNAFTQLEFQLSRRYELITALINLIDQIQNSDTFASLDAAHNSSLQALELAGENVGDAVAMAELIAAQKLLLQALERTWQDKDLEENQPAIANIKRAINNNSDKVNEARESYNLFVKQYNDFRASLPNVLIANFYNFNRATMLND